LFAFAKEYAAKAEAQTGVHKCGEIRLLA